MLINIILIVVVIISGWFLVEYNLFIRKSNKIKESEAQIDVLLNQRLSNYYDVQKSKKSKNAEIFQSRLKNRRKSRQKNQRKSGVNFLMCQTKTKRY